MWSALVFHCGKDPEWVVGSFPHVDEAALEIRGRAGVSFLLKHPVSTFSFLRLCDEHCNPVLFLRGRKTGNTSVGMDTRYILASLVITFFPLVL